MYLLILESIGTSELILIGLIALIVFGPRKLPQMAKSIGKTMAEFRRAGQEFKTTWEKEVTLEEEEKSFFKDPLDENLIIAETKYTQTTTVTETKILPPEIKEVSGADFNQSIPPPVIDSIPIEKKPEIPAASKQDWL